MHHVGVMERIGVITTSDGVLGFSSCRGHGSCRHAEPRSPPLPLSIRKVQRLVDGGIKPRGCPSSTMLIVDNVVTRWEWGCIAKDVVGVVLAKRRMNHSAGEWGLRQFIRFVFLTIIAHPYGPLSLHAWYGKFDIFCLAIIIISFLTMAEGFPPANFFRRVLFLEAGFRFYNESRRVFFPFHLDLSIRRPWGNSLK